MKISVDDKKLFELSDIQKRVICNDIPHELFEQDMKRRLHYILNHKYNQCFKRLKEEWDPKLSANGVQSIPTDPDAYARLVFAQPTYKNRSERDQEERR